MNSRFQPGDHILTRYVFRGRVVTAANWIVVMDSPELIVTWIPLDTTVMNGVVDGENHLTGRQFADLAWEMVPRKWRTAVTLRLKSPSAMWSLWVFWDEGMSSLKAWYINIDAPFKRTRLGFDTWDMFLDIVVAPDRKSWRYKDEDEFADAISAGICTPRKRRKSGRLLSRRWRS
ncbi:MAG: DUF402 domain-containing protein [Dehalococcoidia bacterium]|nr:DUF402 domain-containing protein [Dehalococcoidia bacterium]